MSRGREYQYERIDRALEAQDDWYLQRRKEIQEEDEYVQTKLEISQPGDVHEQEADRIASIVVGGGNANVNTHTSFSSIQPSGTGTEMVDDGFKTSLDGSRGGGNALDESTRSEMESRMGADFSGVKIHTDSSANQMSESINAKAFTYGNDVYFNEGKYNPASSEGKELLAHELVHTVQQSGNVQTKIQRSPLSPRQFADRYFKKVPGYTWLKLQGYLGSDGSKEGNEKLEILLSSLIDQNPFLSPEELWIKLGDPIQLAQLNGYDSSVMYTEGTNKLPQYTRPASTLATEVDGDSDMHDLQTGTIDYARRKHFIFGKKRREAKRKAASDQATAFLQQTANNIDAIVVNANNSKHALETDLQNMQTDLNTKLVTDAMAKEQQTFADIATIRENAINAKDDMRRYYYGSLTVIRINTEKQKDKLQAYANDTIAKLNELENTQDVEIQNLYNTFNAHVEQIEGERNQEAYRQGANRTTEIYANSDSPSSVKSKQQVGIFVEVYKVQNEISTLAGKTKQDALGTVPVPNSSFNNEAEYKANLSKQQAITDINTKVENTNALLDQRALADNQVAKSIRDKYDQMIDTQAIAIIETLTKSLQVYYGKLNEFGALQDAAIQSFYSKSVADLNAAYTTQVQQSKTRLEAFKTSQTGLKTPKKKKLPEDISLASADIDPLVSQANANVGNVVQANTTGFADLNTAMQTAFSTMSQRGTSDLANLMTSVSEELEATRLKGIDEQMRMREVHLRQIIRDVKGSQKTLDQEIAELTIVYQEQLAKLDDDLQKELDQFKTDSKVILDGLNEKMDAAIIAADVSSRAKLIYDALNKQPFKKAELLAALNGVSPSIVPALRREYDEKYSPLRKNRSLFDDIYYEMSLDYQGLFDVFCRLLSPTEPLNLSEGGTQNLATFVSPEYLNPEIASQLPAQKKGTAGLSISVKNPETMSGINETVPSGSSFIVAVDEIGYSFRAQGTSAAELKLALVKKPNGSLFANSRVIEIEDAEVGVYDFIYLMDKDGVLVPFRIQQKVIDIAAAGEEMMSDPDKVTGEDYDTYFARLHEQKQKIGGGVVREQNFTSPYISLSNQYMDNPSDRQFLPDKNGYQIVQPTSGCTYKWYARQTSTGATYDTHWKPDYVDPSQNKIIYDQAFTYLGTGNSVGICLDMQGHLAIVAEEYNAQGVPTGVFVNYLQYVLVERTYYFNEDNPYEEDPQGEVVALRQIETAISDSREYIKKIAGTPVAVKTGYINTESGTQMSLPIFVGKSANPGKGKYVLVDLLPGQKDRLYYGDSIQACIDQFDSYNVYPEGMIFMEVMANDQGFPLIKKNFVSDGRTPWELFTTTTGWISIGLFIVGAAASLVPGGQGVGAGLIYASIAVGAVSALSSIYDESQKGEPDTGKIIIDTIMLAGSICALGGAAFKALNVANARPIVGKVGLFLEFAGAYSLTGTGVFLSAQGVVQIQEILKSDLPLSEKIAQIAQILFFLGAGLWLFAKAGKGIKVKITKAAELKNTPLSGEGRTFNHFTDKNGAAGITGVDIATLDAMEIGEGYVIKQVKFGTGKSVTYAEGNEIFVTDFPTNTSKGKLNNMGVFESTGKQDWVISFSESDALNQGARVSPRNTDRGIYAIPANSTLNGTYHVQRVR